MDEMVNDKDCHLCTELQENVEYYDAYEDPEELHSIIQTSSQHDATRPVRNLSKRLQQLETKRGAICARRSYLRNKKVCVLFLLLSHLQLTETYSQHYHLRNRTRK